MKNIGIIHNREWEDGVLKIELYEDTAKEKTQQLLSQHGYHIHIRK